MAPKSTDPTPPFPDDDPSRDIDPVTDSPHDPELERMLNDLAAKIGPAALGAMQTDRKIAAAEEAQANEAKRVAQINALWNGNPLHDKDGNLIEAIPTTNQHGYFDETGTWHVRERILSLPERPGMGVPEARLRLQPGNLWRIRSHRRESKEDRDNTFERAHHKLERMPASHEGSPIWGYFSPEAAEILHGITSEPRVVRDDGTVELYNKHFLGKGSFDMYLRHKGYDKDKYLIKDAEGTTIRGILLSELNIAAMPCPIAICSDGSIRMYYGGELFGHHKLPTGWGPLLSPEELIPLLDGGARTIVNEFWRRGKSLQRMIDDHTGTVIRK